MDLSMALNSIIRLLVAGLLGAIIGLEREYRAKEAGIRTHFLVALGSALMMLVSQYGFCGCLAYLSDTVPVTEFKLDPSRVAAQVVSGIGFLGAGTIMMHKQIVHGLTTAAGIWAVAGIGLAIGGGMYVIGTAGAFLILAGLETLHWATRGIRSHMTSLSFLIGSPVMLIEVIRALTKNHYKIAKYSVTQQDDGKLKVDLAL